MAFERKVGKGSLSVSKFHAEGDKRPTHFGDILLDMDLLNEIVANNNILALSMWVNDTGFSLSVDSYTMKKGAEETQAAAGESPVDPSTAEKEPAIKSENGEDNYVPPEYR